MDERLAVLSERVAAAADAWLTDPQDLGVYGRLVHAIRERRAYLNPTLDEHAYEPGATPPDEPLPPIEMQPDEVLDGLADQGPVQQLGSTLRDADPRELLARLRGAPFD